MNRAIEHAIDQLGYRQEPTFYHHEDSARWSELPRRTLRTLEELKPYAFLCIDERPFIVFFDTGGSDTETIRINQSCWNAQIPVVLLFHQEQVTIYNGLRLLSGKKTLDILPIHGYDDLTLSNIQSQPFWDKCFIADDTLDALLLDNIKSITNNLRANGLREHATRIILRLIFIRYLVDRGINFNFFGFNGNRNQDRELLKEIVTNKNELYDLFEYLQIKFNGGMFAVQPGELESLTDRHLLDLSSFISGDINLRTGQKSFFDLYDFRILPIELLSAIYEKFIGAETQQEDKAFYTPPYLVEHILDKLFAGKNIQRARVLDPACGSGVFLVEALRRIIEQYLQSGDRHLDPNLLRVLAETAVTGVDLNPEAVAVTKFSICVLLLDYVDPKHLLLFKMPELQRNIIRSDTFREDLPFQLLSDGHFDYIVGNPPWGNKGGSHLEYCTNRGIPQQYHEICRSFIARTRDFSSPETICCLIIASKILYNKAGDAPIFRRKYLLDEMQVMEIIELSTVRRLVFNQVAGPAAIITFHCRPSPSDHHIQHATLKPSVFYRLFHFLVVSKADRKRVPIALLRENDFLWKLLLFGNLRDFEFIKRLQKAQPLQSFLAAQQLSMANGLQVGGGDENDASELHDLKYLRTSKGLPYRYFLDASTLPKFDLPHVHRPRKRAIYEGQKVLFKKAIAADTFENWALYTDVGIVFHDSMSSIYGDPSDPRVFQALTILLNSPLFAYYLLMTGSSAGVEREQAHNEDERLLFPVLMTEAFLEQSKRWMTSMGRLLTSDQLDRKDEYEELESEAWNLVSDLYGLSDEERDLIEYARAVTIPQIRQEITVFSEATQSDIEKYLEVFKSYFNSIGDYLPTQPTVTVAGTRHHLTRVVFVDFAEEKDSTRVSRFKPFMERLMFTPESGLVLQQNSVFSFEGDSMAIVKLNERRFWNRATASSDLSDLLRQAAEHRVTQ